MNNEMFINNRKKLVESLDDNSIMIVFSLPGNEEKFDVNKNFYFATGDDEVDDILVISKTNGKVNEMIFIHPYDEFKAKWVGRTYYKDEITKLTGINHVLYLDSFESHLNMLLGNNTIVYLDFDRSSKKAILSYEETFANELKEKYPYVEFKNARSAFAKARTVKSAFEIELVKKAISITNKGIEAILTNLKPGEYEYQIESYFDQAIKYNGANGFAFPTIAASGENATCLHYGKNNCVMNKGDLILFDLGADYNQYHADISRTFPVDGKFSERQKTLYNIVLEGQKVVMDFVKPGVTTRDANNELIKYFAKALKEIGLINDDSEVSKYYFHGVSHHLGLDTHDLCDYKPLEPGCIISCEPGLYIKEEKIGIRIEDDLLVTPNGCINLSEEIIKSVEDIEAFMAKHNKR